jgi:hypothetical protein
MKRHISGLNQAAKGSEMANDSLEGLFLVRIARVHYHWHPRKPYFVLRFIVLEPKSQAGRSIEGHLQAAPKALWKLTWLLHDFHYGTELLGNDEIDDQQLIGLNGMIKITYTVVNGKSVPNLDGFAPASQWEKLSAGMQNIFRASKVDS